jgi:CBS domain containing-hemolysin-like protein
MGDDSSARLWLVCLFILLAGFFSAGETAYSFCNKIRIKQLSDSGDARAAKTEKVLENFDEAIVSLLIGTNLCTTASAAICTLLCVRVWGQIGSLLSTIFVTIVTFILAETIPKNYARQNCDRFSMAISGFILLYMKILHPISFLFTRSTDFLKKKISGGSEKQLYTEDEFQDIVENIEEEGVLEPEEREVIQNSVDFCDIPVQDIYRPLSEVQTIHLSDPPEKFHALLIHTVYSRLPVEQEGNPNHFIGFLRVNDFLLERIKQPMVLPEAFVSPAIIVSPEQKISLVFEEMRRKKCHMAFVLSSDEQMVGILTMEDILNELMGLENLTEKEEAR